MKNFINELKSVDYRGWAFLIIAIILMVSSVLGGLYVGLVICIAGGIIDIVHGVQSNPMEAGKIAFGVVKFISASFAGVFTFLFGIFCSKVFINRV